MKRTNKLALSTLTLALMMATTAHATSFKTEVTDEQKAEYFTHAANLKAAKESSINLKAKSLIEKGVKPSDVKKFLADSLTNGDDKNLEINTETFFKMYGCDLQTNVCEKQPSDMSNNEIHLAVVHDPMSLENQVSLGSLYKFAYETVDQMNIAFADSKVETRVKLVSFSELDISDFHEKQKQAYIDAGLQYLYDLSPEAFAPEALDWSFPITEFVNSDGFVQKGISGITADIVQSWKGYPIAFTTNFTKRLQNTGADGYQYIRMSDAQTVTICGSGVGDLMGGDIVAQDYMNTERPDGCKNTSLHELGHGLLAGHERTAGNHTDTYNRAAAINACSKDEFGYDMPSVMNTSPAGAKSVFSSPFVINDGVVCGDETEAYNAKQIELSSPFMANLTDEMTVVGTVQLKGELTKSVNISDGAISVVIGRNGDLTIPTEVSLYLDGSTILGFDAENGGTYYGTKPTSITEVFKFDYISVEFGAGESEKVVTLNFSDDLKLQENVVVNVNLVMPVQLAVDVDAERIALTIVANDAPVEPTDPTPVDPTDPTPVDPTDPTPVDPTDPTPVDPTDPTPVDPVDPTPVDPVDPTPVEPEKNESSGGSLGWLAIFGLALVARLRK
ncbi:GlyGly-CTERM sorting domain-containing protein [Shewanella sp. BF02_Schw]|uniref:GlyGly-CTERM sorting domain-containing protein n=1 Tax=Shewanella sp. BF02_Schw TaxID=394908 RepID=UPI00177D037E|nr:GlyGly-CTERM sorting domain-containing protein [Shewanella sp. BF02_Schw]MBO1897707.1 GlyGly-CTERM sorting domain-containing protein [Shewanella sp. BF02_Schw]